MRLDIKDKNGKCRGSWVAKTIRGFNKKQKKEIEAIREELRKQHESNK